MNYKYHSKIGSGLKTKKLNQKLKSNSVISI